MLGVWLFLACHVYYFCSHLAPVSATPAVSVSDSIRFHMAAILRGYLCGDGADDRLGYYALALLRRYYTLRRRGALYHGCMLRQAAGVQSPSIPWGSQGAPMGDVPGLGRCGGCRRARKSLASFELHLRCLACGSYVSVSVVRRGRRFAYLVWLVIRRSHIDRADAIERIRLLKHRCSIRRAPS